jgi:FlaA1/EpsC-like NDP-sugar epimerase
MEAELKKLDLAILPSSVPKGNFQPPSQYTNEPVAGSVAGRSGQAGPAIMHKLRALWQHCGRLIRSFIIGEQMLAQFKNSRLYLMVLIDASIFVMAYTGAYLLRFEFALTSRDLAQIMLVLPWLVPLKLAVLFAFGLYRGMWRYSSLHDLWRLALGWLFSTLLAVSIVLFVYGFTGFSRAVFLLDGLLSFIMTGGARVAIRTCYSAKTGSKGAPFLSLKRFSLKPPGLKRILVIGAGGSGEKLLREIFDNPHACYEVVGFLDDDPGKRGRAMHGVPVFGAVDLLPVVLRKHNIEQVFISIPSASGAEMRRIIDICKGCRIAFKTLPAIGQILDGHVSIKALRDVAYADLLRRQPVQLDMTGIQNYLMGQTILVTGCGGSIGSELCRQLVRFRPAKLVLFDICEANLFYIQRDLLDLDYQNCELVLGPIQRRELTRGVFSRFRPQVVFHAAAYKHVPMLEQNCWAAIFNNVLGSQVLMESAVEFGVRHFVLVSTDKAVRPASVMGASKRLAELIMQSLRGQGTQFKAVRFGNVVGSSGSVVTLFRRQIELGGPVTVTHPEITRYFMTIPEAAQLIIQAGALAEEGDIFILEMGTPVKITEMAQDLIRLSGKEPGREIEIKFIGLRPGEKLYEELVANGEDVVRTRNERIMVVRSNGVMGKAETRENFRQYLNRQIQDLVRIAASQEARAVKRKLKEIIPEYDPEACGVVLKDGPANGSPGPDESLLPDGFPAGVRMGR